MTSVTGTAPHHYEKLNLKEGVIQRWEDGLRTDPGQRSFEWWYFDCQLDDGSKLMIDFHTKPPYLPPSHPLTPFISLTLDRADGIVIKKACMFPAETFSASRESCDVRIGNNRFAGDPERGYGIHVEIEELVMDIDLIPSIPPWRPASGHVFFGEQEEYYVAWLPVVPRGLVTARLFINGRHEERSGHGYHDHNWGNMSLSRLIDHWYWGRAHIGEYSVITLMFHGNQTYGNNSHPAFMVAKGGRIVVSGVADLGFTASEMSVNAKTGVPFANRLRYEVQREDAYYAVTFTREKDVFDIDLGKGAYHRFLGDVTLEHRVKDQLVERVNGNAIWELLYFGARGPVPTKNQTNHPASPGLIHQS